MKIKFFALFIVFSGFTFHASGQVNFDDNTFQNIISKAKEENKLVMVDSYTNWCGWCKVMDRETFSDSLVGEYINDKFISTKVNMEEGFGIDLAMKYRVSFYPQYLFFDGEGHLIGRLGGFMDSQPFIEAVEGVLNPDNYLPPLDLPMDFVMDYPDFYKNSFKKRKERSYPTPDQVTVFLDGRTDLTDEASWGVISRFVSNGVYAESVLENKTELTKKYGKQEVTEKLATFVFSEVKAAIKDSSEAELYDALDMADEMLGNDSESYKLRYRLYFFQMTNDWEAYAGCGVEIANNKYIYNSETLNQIAWTLYERDNDLDNLQLAADWMEALTEKEPSYTFLDTYASVLFKLKAYTKAKGIAEKALAAAETEDTNPKETMKLLDRINASI